MKRKLAIVVGAAAVSLAAYLGSSLSAQNTGVQPAGGTTAPANQVPLRSRIALLNLSNVVKQYKKWTNFQEEMKGMVTSFEAKLQEKKKVVEGHQQSLAKTTDPAARDQFEKSIRAIQREMQEYGEDAKQQLARKEGDQIVIIYKEVYQAAEAYAKAHDIELVMHYNDVINKDDINTPANVQRKMTTGACMPLVMDPRMDITNDVAWMLNNYYERSMGAGARAPAGTPNPAAPGVPRP